MLSIGDIKEEQTDQFRDAHVQFEEGSTLERQGQDNVSKMKLGCMQDLKAYTDDEFGADGN